MNNEDEEPHLYLISCDFDTWMFILGSVSQEIIYSSHSQRLGQRILFKSKNKLADSLS